MQQQLPPLHAQASQHAPRFKSAMASDSHQNDEAFAAKNLVAHAYYCRNTTCKTPSCHDTKQKLIQLAKHSQTCKVLTPPEGIVSADACRMCRMWNCVKQMRPPTEFQGQPPPRPPAVGQGGPGLEEVGKGGKGGTNKPSQLQMVLGVGNRRLPAISGGGVRRKDMNPDVVKQKVRDHLRTCYGCEKCRRWREELQRMKRIREEP